MDNGTNLFGGYQMIDMKNLNLLESEEVQKRPGLYAKCQKAIKHNKPVIAYNCIWGEGKPITPIQVFLIQISNDTIIGTSSTLQVIVSDNDNVVINNLVS